MTPEEEELFRKAAREALAESVDVLMVARVDGSSTGLDFAGCPDFSVIRFDAGPVGILIPGYWATVEDMEARLHGILREESKALAGEALD